MVYESLLSALCNQSLKTYRARSCLKPTLRMLVAIGGLLLQTGSIWADEHFPIALPECPATLERRTVEPNVLIVRSDCPLSLQSLTTLLDSGFQTLSADQRLSIHGIYFGRLMDYPEWSHVLARVAAKSLAWNAKRGRPSKAGESDNKRVRLLLNGPAYPQIVQSLFANYHLTACISDVEKVLVFKAKDIWPDKTAIPKGVSVNVKLPVDAQVWLRFEPLSTPCVDQ
jgi:hypothetical protein